MNNLINKFNSMDIKEDKIKLELEQLVFCYKYMNLSDCKLSKPKQCVKREKLYKWLNSLLDDKHEIDMLINYYLLAIL